MSEIVVDLIQPDDTNLTKTGPLVLRQCFGGSGEDPRCDDEIIHRPPELHMGIGRYLGRHCRTSGGHQVVRTLFRLEADLPGPIAGWFDQHVVE